MQAWSLTIASVMFGALADMMSLFLGEFAQVLLMAFIRRNKFGIVHLLSMPAVDADTDVDRSRSNDNTSCLDSRMR
jgi:hypothetical protein